MLSGALAISTVLSVLQAVLAQEAWNEAMNAIELNCYDTYIDNDEVAFQGFKDECDNLNKAPFKPEHPDDHLDLVIDPRNADMVLWDVNRYKRYGTYEMGTHMNWNVTEGFQSLSAQVYYVEDYADRFGHMRYQGSVDGIEWTEITDITYKDEMCTMAGCWYKMVEETKQWHDGTTYFYLKAIWPPPCQSELDNPTVRSCKSLSTNEFDKDLYYAPQLGQIILGLSATSPSKPINVTATPGVGTLTVSWESPAHDGGYTITGYVVYYRTNSPLLATEKNYNPPYDSLRQNVGNVHSIILSNLDPTRTYIVQIAAINEFGAGPSTLNVWGTPLKGRALVKCPLEINFGSLKTDDSKKSSDINSQKQNDTIATITDSKNTDVIDKDEYLDVDMNASISHVWLNTNNAVWSILLASIVVAYA